MMKVVQGTFRQIPYWKLRGRFHSCGYRDQEVAEHSGIGRYTMSARMNGHQPWTSKEIQENLIRTVRDMLLTSCEKMGAQSIEHCWTRHDGTEVKLILAIHPAGEKEEKPEDELYTYARAAVQKFGMNKQVDMAIEEMSELTKALLKYRRASDCATTVKSGDNIREEMEDVRIMLAQLDCIYGRSPQWAEKKLAHLKELVKGEEGDGDV